MNAKFKKIIAILGAVAIVLSFAACKGKKDDETTTTEATTAETTTEATTVADETTAASGETTTEASKEKTTDEIVQAFNTAYAASYSSLKVTDAMKLENIHGLGKTIEGAAKKIVDPILSSSFKSKTQPMAPSSDATYTNSGKCNLTAAEVATATYKDNGNGTATIKICPKQTNMSKKGADGQGKLFNVFGDMATSIQGAGFTYESCTVTYPATNYVEITYNTSSNVISKYSSKMVAKLELKGASGYAVLKNINGGVDLVYEQHN
ncbi:MAG: hypothetical protein K5917_07330 [Clostridiales bacterium]|nr:hypothetical protein [Clostridiales bacterium]